MCAQKIYPQDSYSVHSFHSQTQRKEVNTAGAQQWLQLIRANDYEEAVALLQEFEDLQELINGRFYTRPKFSSEGMASKTGVVLTDHRNPVPWWLMVARCTSQKLIQLFLENNVNVNDTDDNGNNFIHTLVTTAALNPQQEERCCLTLQKLINKLDKTSSPAMLMQENNQGLRPVEMAAKDECWKLFQSIMSTEDVYLQHSEDCGNILLNSYSITDYERSERTFESPLLSFMRISTKGASFLTSHPEYLTFLKVWSSTHTKSVHLYIVFFFLVNIFNTVVFSVFDTYVAAVTDELVTVDNATSATNETCLMQRKQHIVSGLNKTAVRWTVLFCLMGGSLLEIFHCVLLWITFVKEKLSQKVQKRTCPERMHQLMSCFPYIVAQNLHCTTIVAASVFDILTNNRLKIISPGYQDAMYNFIQISCILVVASHSVFLESFGDYFLVVEGMSHTGHFLLMLVMLWLSFLTTNQRIFNRGKNQCLLNFDLSIPSIYILVQQTFSFSVVQHVFNLEPQSKKYAAMATHLTYMLMAGVVLMNFLIALYSFTANEINETKEIRMLIKRLRVSVVYVFVLLKIAFVTLFTSLL